MADTTTEKLKTRSERELEKLGEGMESGEAARKKKKKKAKKKKKKAAENVGTGQDNTEANNAAIIAQWRTKAAAARAAGNNAMAAQLEARIKQATEGT